MATPAITRNKRQPLLKGQDWTVNPEIQERIDLLVELNDLYKLAVGKRAKKQLRRLANKYDAIGCRQLASDVRRQARSC